MSDVVVVVGAGSIGQAIARRVSVGKHVVLADLNQDSADAAAEVLSNAGFDVSTIGTGRAPCSTTHVNPGDKHVGRPPSSGSAISWEAIPWSRRKSLRRASGTPKSARA